MESIRDKLLDVFEQYSDDDAGLMAELQSLITEKGNIVYSLVFQILTNLDLSPVEAEKHWRQIILNRTNLNKTIGRDLNIRTVVCDYFCSINKSLHNPKIIEISLFEKATRSSTFDSLTGLLNRKTFDESLKREISRANRYEANLSLLFLDVDDFKKVNDTFGQLAGDEVLKKIAQIIMAEKRAEDIAARYGGEEITLLLPETGKADGGMIGERIRKRIEATLLDFEGQSINVTISGGLAAFPIDAGDDLALLKNADLAMYLAKSAGKNNISFYSSDKRKNIRVDYRTEVEIQELGIHDKPMSPAITKSLSTGGVLLESQRPFKAGAKIQISLDLAKGNPLIIIGSVVRSEKIANGNHEVSINFLDSNRILKNEISRYLAKHLKGLQAQNPLELHILSTQITGRDTVNQGKHLDFCRGYDKIIRNHATVPVNF